MSRPVALLARPRDAGRRRRHGTALVPDRRPHRFAMVPEKLLEADVSATAVRLYGLLLRCPVVDGAHVQSRARLAERLHRSVDTVDRAVGVLVDAGWVEVVHRFSDGRQISNGFLLLPAPTGGEEEADTLATSTAPTQPSPVDEQRSGTGWVDHPPFPGEHIDPDPGELQPAGGGRRSAARGAASVRHGRESWTQRTSSPSPPHPRSSAGGASRHRSHPFASTGAAPAVPTAEMEARLDELDGLRPLVQRQAREELLAEGMPLTRSSVTWRSCAILDRALR